MKCLSFLVQCFITTIINLLVSNYIGFFNKPINEINQINVVVIIISSIMAVWAIDTWAYVFKHKPSIYGAEYKWSWTMEAADEFFIGLREIFKKKEFKDDDSIFYHS